jgi:hypothetical protein
VFTRFSENRVTTSGATRIAASISIPATSRTRSGTPRRYVTADSAGMGLVKTGDTEVA